LLGIGHLQRALGLAGALAARDFAVTVVSGGMPRDKPLPAGIDLVQLPPLRSRDGSFTTLLDSNDRPIDDDWRAARGRQLLDLFQRLSPNILLTETFPFGRRMLRFELIPLLEAAQRYPGCRLVVSSVRDILQPKSGPGREDEIVDLVERYYDRVLVHGDARIVRLEDSFAAAARIADKTCYTGYIAPRPKRSELRPGKGEVLVSAGGSATGLALLRNAIEARPLTGFAQLRWRLLVSDAIDEPDFDQLREAAGDGIVVERNRADFPSLLARSALSISQAGYNTMAELLACATPAVVVPYAEAEEMEQRIRAECLRRLGRVAVVDEDELTPAALARAADRAARLDTRIEADLDGVKRSAELIAEHYRRASGASATVDIQAELWSVP